MAKQMSFAVEKGAFLSTSKVSETGILSGIPKEHSWSTRSMSVATASSSTQPQQQDYKVVLAGIVHNVAGDHLRHQIPKMIRLGKTLAGSTGHFHILIYENDSTSETRNTLRTLLDEEPHATYIYEDVTTAQSSSRTDRIAAARNRMMDEWENYVQHNQPCCDFLMVTDMDGVCGGADPSVSYDPAIFQYALSRHSEWDGISFRFVPYWDLWALRHPDWMPENREGPNNSLNKVRKASQFDAILDRWSSRTKLIPVDSAFMMMAIYKTDTVKGIRYGSRGSVDGEADCEHAVFHKSLRKERHARLRLLPMVYCQGDEGYLPLAEQKRI